MVRNRVLVLDAFSELLGEAVPPGRWVLAGSPEARLSRLAGFPHADVGLWEISEGTVQDVEQDEVFVVLSGSATVAFDDGETIELGPGSCVRLHSGDRTTWDIRTTLCKIYVIG
jgi:uncharacterized protein